jgi:heme exporter protein B
MSLIALVVRDIRLATRVGGNAFLAIAFFGASLTLIPLGVGAEIGLLAAIAAGVLWVSAVLAALLSLDRLFQADFEDGTLDLLAMGPRSLESIAAAKIAAHWLTTGLPLTCQW